MPSNSSGGRLSNVFDNQMLNQQNSKGPQDVQYSQMAGGGSTGSTGMAYQNKSKGTDHISGGLSHNFQGHG